MARNADEPTRDLFGVQLPDGTGAPGSPGGHGQAADNVTGVRVTSPTGGYYDQNLASTGGTVEPGQSDPSAIAPDAGGSFTDTGAGQGGTDHWKRYSWQQGRGR
jgi:hypothetical protein